MTALSADRNTPLRDGIEAVYDVAAATEIFAGSLVVLDTSGNAEPGTTATGKICVGRAEEYVNNTGAAGAKTVTVKSGVFRWVNGESFTKAHIGDTAYILDDQTVYRTATGKSPAGVVVDVDADGVWVKTSLPWVTASAGLLAANNLSDVSTAATALTNIGGDKRYVSVRCTDLVGGNAARYGFVAPAGGTISKIWSLLLGHALATGNATLTGKINGTSITNGAVTITQAGSAIGDVDSASPSALKTVVAGDFVELLVGGTNDNAAAFAEVLVEISLS